ncbi:MAG: DUF4145 domain-containing protein [Erysipelotrichaceae bacterium]|nr:DUF4145 domain-containing protein [Erysipelotrichaceae bacterium]
MVKNKIKIKGQEFIVSKPTTCPYCDKGIDAIIVKKFTYRFYDMENIVVTYKCSCCEQIFFSKYQVNPMAIYYENELYPFETIGGHKVKHDFSNEIKEISPSFVSIYNDAYIAEQSGCTEIVGIGYRRSFEFLIKDYAIKYHQEDETTIKNMSLAKCVEKYAPNEATKELLLRATWIGNDFAHYETKHEEINLNDLKNLIDLSVDAIEKNIKIKNYIANIEHK